MKYITNSETYHLDTVVIDLNWTLVVWGEMEEEVKESLQQLKEKWFTLYLLTGDQRWEAHLYEKYWLEIIKVKNSEEKEAFIKTLNTESCIAIGNARIDIGMFKHAKVSIATIQGEWIHTWILSYVDILIPSMVDALKLFIDPDRFAATMKV